LNNKLSRIGNLLRVKLQQNGQKKKKLIETFIDIIHQSTWEQYWWENEIPIVLVYQTLQHQHNQILNYLFIVQDLPTSLIGHIISTKDIF
jgi:inorganic pyrophosphatase